MILFKRSAKTESHFSPFAVEGIADSELMRNFYKIPFGN